VINDSKRSLSFGKLSHLKTDAATSERLGRIRQHGTSAELLVRKVVTRLGGRYRVTNRDLPGSPDLANRKQRWAIFVHGCYWHSHTGCVKATVPKRNRAFWLAKFAANKRRDAAAMRKLRQLGYKSIVVWECEVRMQRTQRRIRKLLTSVD
jgi:DNA mismatch endonuclease, patch repair protein